MGMRDYTYDEVREIFSHDPTLLEEFDRAFPDVDAEDADEEDDEPETWTFRYVLDGQDREVIITADTLEEAVETFRKNYGEHTSFIV